MCRLLCVKADRPFDSRPYLEAFAAIARDSKEYQGHGWGCAWLADGEWRFYHTIKPVWEDRRDQAGPTTLLLAHARSAFRDEGICVQNNMPFFDGEHVFIFNGELRGVRIKQQGRIGAEKIFNYIKRFDRGDTLHALRRAIPIIAKKTRYIRAMNIVMASRESIYLASSFNEDPAYFQMQTSHDAGVRIICSEAYQGDGSWTAVANGAIEVY